MKKITRCLFALALLCSSPMLVNAQTFTVPAGYVLKTEADFAEQVTNIVSAVNWLEVTPLNAQEQKRKDVNAFVMAWVAGSPTVSIELKKDVTDLAENNPDLLVMYMGGWARFNIQNAREKNPLKAHLEGLKSMVRVYKLGDGVKPSPKMDELVKVETKGMLETWGNEHFN